MRAIYLEGIATGQATFETNAPSWEKWDRDHLKAPRLVARDNDEVVGWAALAPVSDRCVYGGVAEVSVYVAASARGRGVGKALLLALSAESEKAGLWTLQAEGQVFCAGRPEMMTMREILGIMLSIAGIRDLDPEGGYAATSFD